MHEVDLRICLVFVAVGPVAAQAPVTPKPPKASAEFVETPAQADEPLAEQFSLVNAAKSLDAGAINFSQKHRCVQCHANLMYLAARPALEKIVPSPADMRAFQEWIVQTRWEKYGVIYDRMVQGPAGLSRERRSAAGDRANRCGIRLGDQ